MQIRRNIRFCGLVVFWVLLSFVCTSLIYAQPPTQDGAYEVSSVLDTLIMGDSIIVIHTVCAPICSSHACVYNKEWQSLGELTPPIRTVFPEAYIENNQLLWRDNDTLSYKPVY